MVLPQSLTRDKPSSITCAGAEENPGTGPGIDSTHVTLMSGGASHMVLATRCQDQPEHGRGCKASPNDNNRLAPRGSAAYGLTRF